MLWYPCAYDPDKNTEKESQIEKPRRRFRPLEINALYARPNARLVTSTTIARWYIGESHWKGTLVVAFLSLIGPLLLNLRAIDAKVGCSRRRFIVLGRNRYFMDSEGKR